MDEGFFFNVFIYLFIFLVSQVGQFYLFKNYHFATEFRGRVEILFVYLFVC